MGSGMGHRKVQLKQHLKHRLRLVSLPFGENNVSWVEPIYLNDEPLVAAPPPQFVILPPVIVSNTGDWTGYGASHKGHHFSLWQ
ncbi:hypothetical protein V6N12_059898 [Hibiscus sabdariffa]|uniref:Uncharacterized protein n=1 Tax=Hibiscus sabdariffa TaxID=183260 RepID=A0ABR2D388_9ROSI